MVSPWRRGDRVTEARLARARENRVAEASLRRGMSAQLGPPPKAERAPWKSMAPAQPAEDTDDHEEDRTT
jgi:hypothetical protein